MQVDLHKEHGYTLQCFLKCIQVPRCKKNKNQMSLAAFQHAFILSSHVLMWRKGNLSKKVNSHVSSLSPIHKSILTSNMWLFLECSYLFLIVPKFSMQWFQHHHKMPNHTIQELYCSLGKPSSLRCLISTRLPRTFLHLVKLDKVALARFIGASSEMALL